MHAPLPCCLVVADRSHISLPADATALFVSQVTARMGHWEASPLRTSYMQDFRADGLLALGGWPGDCFSYRCFMLLTYTALTDAALCSCAAKVVHHPAEVGNGNLGMFFDERFDIPVPNDLIEEVVFPFLPRFKQWVWPSHPLARDRLQHCWHVYTILCSGSAMQHLPSSAPMSVSAKTVVQSCRWTSWVARPARRSWQHPHCCHI